MLSEGQILDGTYRLVRLIGEGGMGVVYEATHARLAGRYAIKVLTQGLADSPEALAHFNREAWITSLLQHPNVVQVIDHNTAPDGTEYLVMEYLDGESLSQRLARVGPLPLEAVVGIVDQIAAGLAAVHARGIVHRDLKPDNVVLVPVEGRRAELCKILDFGLSERRGSLAASGLLCGTPQYMAPEQIEGRPTEVDGSADQFGLAVIAHELLTGRNPFVADTVGETFLRVASTSPPSAGFGLEVDEVLARGLAKSSRERFRSVTDFAEALRAAARAREQNDQGQATRQATESRPRDRGPKRKMRRHNWGVALGATVATTLAMSLAGGGPPGRVAAHDRAPARSAAALPSTSTAIPPSVAEPRATEPAFLAAPPPVVEAMDDLPAPPPVPATTATTPIRHSRRRAAPPRPRPAIVDEDATMPLSGMSGDSPSY